MYGFYGNRQLESAKKSGKKCFSVGVNEKRGQKMCIKLTRKIY